jgi:LPS-assembly lipoprotein
VRRCRISGPRTAPAIAIALLLSLSACGWAPLYADPQSGPAAAELRAIRVRPIPERIGQRLELALRNALNSTGEPTRERYLLATDLSYGLSNLGLVSQGTATLGKVDLFATFRLIELKGGAVLLINTVHSQSLFVLNPNQYSTVVAQNDAGVRCVAEINEEILTRLNLFLQNRLAQKTAKPT